MGTPIMDIWSGMDGIVRHDYHSFWKCFYANLFPVVTGLKNTLYGSVAVYPEHCF